MDKRGKFIVIDGMDGSGKGTQLRLLQERLAGKGVYFTREPGGSPRAEEIRKMLLQTGGTESNAVCDFFLFWAARGSHVQDVVAPRLRQGTHVLCDRYDSSTYAFQIFGEQAPAWLKNLFVQTRRALPSEYLPDLYLVLDLPAEVAFERRAKDQAQEKSKFDIKPLEYHVRVREGFKRFAAEFGSTAFIDADRTPEQMHADIWGIIEKELG
ncbi:MAG: Thymidylate kinase [Parcubacteria group bacterium GW2011_GWA1_53_13]|nr:MAG: Thymidylate kinase [Parcubacteria group bacterium GW2011_GWA1_53_13]